MFTITHETSPEELRKINKGDLITDTYKTGAVTNIIIQRVENYVSYIFSIQAEDDKEFTELIYVKR